MKILAIRSLADVAITFDLADQAGANAAARVRAALDVLVPAVQTGDLPGAIEVAGAFASVTLHYDPLLGTQSDLIARVVGLLEQADPSGTVCGRIWHLPCCYDAPHGADLNDLAQTLGMTRDAVIQTHAATEFSVYALGFLPGLPFMGDLPPQMSLPRRSSPRIRVPAGSVAIANGLCVIYPWDSPGGWHIVGSCPLSLFDANHSDPALLSPGDRVRFVPVDSVKLDELRQAQTSGDIDLMSFCAVAS
jgi:KipI family sensor histidine kinase inhibitor